MQGVAKHAEDRRTGLHWMPVSGVQPIAYVARLDDRPLAILEFVPGSGYRMTACTGEAIGVFASAEDASRVLQSWLARPREGVTA